jgi:hypothetical protein
VVMKRGILLRSARISSADLLRRAAIAGGKEGVWPFWAVGVEDEKEFIAWARRSGWGVSWEGEDMLANYLTSLGRFFYFRFRCGVVCWLCFCWRRDGVVEIIVAGRGGRGRIVIEARRQNDKSLEIKSSGRTAGQVPHPSRESHHLASM